MATFHHEMTSLDDISLLNFWISACSCLNKLGTHLVFLRTYYQDNSLFLITSLTKRRAHFCSAMNAHLHKDAFPLNLNERVLPVKICIYKIQTNQCKTSSLALKLNKS